MFDLVFGTLRRGAERVFGNPQLLYTVLVALIIVGAFLFMAERFVGIATDAQERLVNVRVGALQDAFVSFAADRLDDPAYLTTRIEEILAANETISDFRIVAERDPLATTTPARGGLLVIASADPLEIGESDPDASFLYTLAAGDPSRSVTLEMRSGGERVFRTARAITGDDGSVLAVAMTTQALSEADRAIEESISGSILMLVGILVIILLLFLRYSKVIDYMALYQKLKEVDQLKDDFISMASHELRTPLSVIRGYAEYIREAPELTPQTKEYATHIDVSAKGLDALVADILDVSRIEQGRMSFTPEIFAPRALMKEVTESFTLPAKEKGLALILDESAAGEEVIRADKDRLKQVLVNLVGNAIKYTPKGEVKVRQYVEKGRLVMRVSDTGLGMSAEEQARLFEKFYRIKTEDTKDIRGTGLGLWITREIVRQMGGSISVESIKGVGSHFIVSFPLSTGTASAKA